MTYPQQLTYDRSEVLHFNDGSAAVHCVTVWHDLTNQLPQASQRLLEAWQDLNPAVVGVSFSYSHPRCDVPWLH